MKADAAPVGDGDPAQGFVPPRSFLPRVKSILRRTPVHPQWLLVDRKAPNGLNEVAGLILDIGAGDRWIKPHVSTQATYFSLDYPPTGSNRYGARPDVHGTAVELPFLDDSLDAVLCLEVIEHLAEPEQAFSEIARVLKPGARAWLSIPFIYPLHDIPQDFQRYTEFGLARELEKVGLELVTMKRWMPAIATAGLIANLAIAGPLLDRSLLQRCLLLPLVVPAVFVINLAASLGSVFWPDWSHLTMGYQFTVRKP